ncbi:hypothetical protein GF351_01355 [Candidatus Woesearchaeota archaeon]|nr:hypothetical protein [Candidatus Woesearchaeota archaeon]
MPFMKAKETFASVNPFQTGGVECREIIQAATIVAKRIERLLALAARINAASRTGKDVGMEEAEMLRLTNDQVNELITIPRKDMLLLHEVIEEMKKIVDKNESLKRVINTRKKALKTNIKDVNRQIRKAADGKENLEQARQSMESQISSYESTVTSLDDLSRTCRKKLTDLHKRLWKVADDMREIAREARKASK